VQQLPTKDPNIMKICLAALTITALVSGASLSEAAEEPKLLVLKARNFYSYGYQGGQASGLPNGEVKFYLAE
jgi:hypothetical protein